MPLWRLRPGFQFARLMTYDELCDFVNMGVRKDGAFDYYLFRLFLFFCCDADASAFVVGVLGANAREAC